MKKVWHDAATEPAPFGRVWVAFEDGSGWHVIEGRRATEINRRGVFYVKLEDRVAGVKWLFMQVPYWSDAQERPPAPNQITEQAMMW